MAKKETNNRSIEETLWQACDRLRGAVEPAEYKHVVLGLLFLKFASDKFEERRDELVSEGQEKYVGMKDFYGMKNVFYLDETSRWSYIIQNAKQNDITLKIDTALHNIEKTNPSLRGALPDNYFSRLGLDVSKLASLLDTINDIDTLVDKEQDIIGRVYEYFLAKFAIKEGKGKGEFYTPKSIVNLIAEMIEPYRGIIYDPACGSGGMFVQSAKFIQQHQGNLRNVTIYGQEFNANTWKMAHMNLAIRGLEADLGDSWGDSFGDDKHATKKFDFIMANPPFNMSDWGASRLADDVRWKYGVPPEGNANYAWIQHMVHHLSPTGRIGLVLANGSLTTTSGGEGDIRQRLIEADLVEGVIAMPNQLFYNVSIPVCVWFFNRKKKNPGKVLFIDAREMGMMVDRTHRELSDDQCRYDTVKKEDKPWANLPAEECDVQRIAAAFRAYESGTLEDVKGFCKVATLDEIGQQDYVLTPGRYVGIADEEEDAEPFEEKMTRLTNELGSLFAESHRLENGIKEKLANFGFIIKEC